MINTATELIIDELKDCGATIGTKKAAELLGISPRGFKQTLERAATLPDWAVEVTNAGERRTFRILTERFASYIGAKEVMSDEINCSA